MQWLTAATKGGGEMRKSHGVNVGIARIVVEGETCRKDGVGV